MNERLGKPDFDCAHLDETYDCGCGDGDESVHSDRTHSGSADENEMDFDTGFGLVRGGR